MGRQRAIKTQLQIGDKVGKLTLIGRRVPPAGSGQHIRWICICDCGTKVIVPNYRFHHNDLKTHCGCANRGLPTLQKDSYGVWNMMIARCTVATHVSYSDYGGRGIKVHPEWIGDKGFETFLKDVGARPSKKHSLDRIDPNGNYVPGNVRWVTLKVQARNKRKSLFIDRPDKNGVMENIPMAQYAEELGLNYQQLRYRLIKEGKWPGIDNVSIRKSGGENA